VPACVAVSSVPVPDADALDMDIHVPARALTRVGGRAHVCIRGYPMGVCAAAPA
jgi:hypothetical protein